jgi:hypothetical protein
MTYKIVKEGQKTCALVISATTEREAVKTAMELLNGFGCAVEGNVITVYTEL